MIVKFQQRHYEAIAEVVAHLVIAQGTREMIICDLSRMFREDNPNFKPPVFWYACGGK